MAKQVEIAVVRKTYQGPEGLRVKAGTRFAVGESVNGLPTISKARYQALLLSKIVRPFGEEDTREAVKYARPLARTVTTMEGPGGKTARAIRESVRRRAKDTDTAGQVATPGAPKQVKGPGSTSPGSQTGAATESSALPAGQAQSKSTGTKSGKRGTRGAAPSEVVKPSASSSSTTR